MATRLGANQPDTYHLPRPAPAPSRAARSKEQAGYVSLSFETISGYGPNGAVIHYAAQKETARALGTDSLFLLVRLHPLGRKLVVVHADVDRSVVLFWLPFCFIVCDGDCFFFSPRVRTRL